jgi:multiple sugar transport system permease protein
MKITRNLPLYLIGAFVFLWTFIPIYHLFVIALSPQQEAVGSGLFPAHPTLQNFGIVFGAKYSLVQYFWHQLWNSIFIAVMVCLITLAISTFANFAITRLRIRGGRVITNIALLTYLIPSAFLAIPMYKTMGQYGLLDSPWSMIFAMVTLASPYAIWVMNQASTKIPYELDEAAKIDGATTLQLFWYVYLPLIVPTIIAIGTYALLLAWNEYLYAFLLLSAEKQLTLAVALGTFLNFDDAPWALLMATGIIYALPPTAIYYAFRRYMVSGLTSGAVKS